MSDVIDRLRDLLPGSSATAALYVQEGIDEILRLRGLANSAVIEPTRARSEWLRQMGKQARESSVPDD